MLSDIVHIFNKAKKLKRKDGSIVTSTRTRALYIERKLLELELDISADIALAEQYFAEIQIKEGETLHQYPLRMAKLKPKIADILKKIEIIRLRLNDFLRHSHNIQEVIGKSDSPLWQRYNALFDLVGGSKISGDKIDGEFDSERVPMPKAFANLVDYKKIIKANHNALAEELEAHLPDTPYTVVIFEWFTETYKKFLGQFDVGGHVSVLLIGKNGEKQYLSFVPSKRVISRDEDSLFNQLAHQLNIPEKKELAGRLQDLQFELYTVDYHRDKANPRINKYYTHYNHYSLDFTHDPEAFQRMFEHAKQFSMLPVSALPPYDFYQNNCSHPVKDLIKAGGIEHLPKDCQKTLKGKFSKPVDIRHFAQNYIKSIQKNTGQIVETQAEYKKRLFLESIESCLADNINYIESMGNDEALLAEWQEIIRSLEKYCSLLLEGRITLSAAKRALFESIYEKLLILDNMINSEEINYEENQEKRKNYLNLATVLGNLTAPLGYALRDDYSIFFIKLKYDLLDDVKETYSKLIPSFPVSDDIPSVNTIINNTFKINLSPPVKSKKEEKNINDIEESKYTNFLIASDITPIHELNNLLYKLSEAAHFNDKGQDNEQNLYHAKRYWVNLKSALLADFNKQTNPHLKVLLKASIDALDKEIGQMNQSLYFTALSKKHLATLAKHLTYDSTHRPVQEVALKSFKPHTLDETLHHIRLSFSPEKELKQTFTKYPDIDAYLKSPKPIVLNKPMWFNVFERNKRNERNLLEAKTQIWQLLSRSDISYAKSLSLIAHIIDEHKPSSFSSKEIKQNFEQLKIKTQLYCVFQAFSANQIDEIKFSYWINKLSKELNLSTNNPLVELITQFNQQLIELEKNYLPIHQKGTVEDKSLSSSYDQLNCRLLEENVLKLNAKGEVKQSTINASSSHFPENALTNTHYLRLFKPTYKAAEPRAENEADKTNSPPIVKR